MFCLYKKFIEEKLLRQKQKNRQKILLFSFFSALAGLVVGLFTSPNSGSKNRQILIDKLSSAKSQTSQLTRGLMSQTKTRVQDIEARLADLEKDLVNKFTDLKHKIQQKLQRTEEIRLEPEEPTDNKKA
jgi:gas vesicle protein